MPFINPYTEKPYDFLCAVGHFIYHYPGNRRGEITEKTVELNRPELIEMRKERIDKLRELADRYESEQNTTLKDILLTQLKIELAYDKEYSMCARSIINDLVT